MADRLTRWEGRDENGPRVVLAKREGSWPENYQEALRKLALYEDSEEKENGQNRLLEQMQRMCYDM